MLKIGITGGIGSGKSMACHVFRLLGIPIYNADIEAKKLYDTDLQLKKEIIELFGKEIYDENIFQAAKLANIVFESDTKLQQLNQLIHPRLALHFSSWCEQQHATYIIKEAALIIESGSYKSLDELVLVSCPIEKRIERVMKRDLVSRKAVLSRIEKQSTDEAKRLKCQHEIVNDDDNLVIPQVLALHQKILANIALTQL